MDDCNKVRKLSYVIENKIRLHLTSFVFRRFLCISFMNLTTDILIRLLTDVLFYEKEGETINIIKHFYPVTLIQVYSIIR